MFHKRLLKEFQDNIKYVIGMVATQWISLVANIVRMLFIANIVSKFVEGDGLGLQDSAAMGLLFVFAAVFFVRAKATSINTWLSFRASENVKHRLREKVYGKLMKLGTNYRDTVSTAEVVQISTEGNHECKSGGGASFMCAIDSDFYCSSTEVCEETVGKILGHLYRTGRYLPGKFAEPYNS